MQRSTKIALVTACAVACGAFLAPSDAAWAKRKPPFKLHFRFGGDVTYSDPPKPNRKHKFPSVYSATVADAPVWVVQSSIETKTDRRNMSLAIPAVDYSKLTFPHTFAPGEIKSAAYGTYAFGTSQVTGYWGIGSGGALTVTLTSWDKRKRRLTGTFEGTMHDAATFLVLPDLNISGGDFGVVIPKPRK